MSVSRSIRKGVYLNMHFWGGGVVYHSMHLGGDGGVIPACTWVGGVVKGMCGQGWVWTGAEAMECGQVVWTGEGVCMDRDANTGVYGQGVCGRGMYTHTRTHAHTHTPRRPVKRPVGILLECILVYRVMYIKHTRRILNPRAVWSPMTAS